MRDDRIMKGWRRENRGLSGPRCQPRVVLCRRGQVHGSEQDWMKGGAHIASFRWRWGYGWSINRRSWDVEKVPPYGESLIEGGGADGGILVWVDGMLKSTPIWRVSYRGRWRRWGDFGWGECGERLGLAAGCTHSIHKRHIVQSSPYIFCMSAARVPLLSCPYKKAWLRSRTS